jgi:hypothetical protein
VEPSCAERPPSLGRRRAILMAPKGDRTSNGLISTRAGCSHNASDDTAVDDQLD